MVRTELITTTEGLRQIQAQWETLEQRDPEATYYVTHRFVHAWWAGYEQAPGHSLRIVTWWQGSDLVGVAPLAVAPGSQSGHRASFLRWATHGDYMTVLAEPSMQNAVYRAFLQHLDHPDGWHAINLPGILGDSSLAHYLLKSPYNLHFKFVLENPFIDLTQASSLDDFTSIPNQTRKYRNKLLRETGVKFRVFRGDEESILDRIAKVHIAEKRHLIESQGRSERHSLYEDPRRLEHIRRVFSDTTDALTFAYLDRSDQVVGYRTTFASRKTLLSWNSAYLPEYEKYRIGKVIQYDILEHLFRTGGVDRFDFGAGRYPWKFEWTNQYRSTYRIARRQVEPELPTTAPAAQPPTVKPTPAPEAPRPALQDFMRKSLRHGKRRARKLLEAAKRRIAPPVIWYIPHADDETIFMGGSIASTRDRRNILVLLTQGGASFAITKVSERLGAPVTPEEFMRARKNEFMAAIAHLGVRLGDIVQHELPDGAVNERDVYSIVADQARQHPRAAHRTMSWLDPHPDHRAAGEALRRAKEEGIVDDALFHLPVPVLAAEEFDKVPLDRAAKSAKRKALDEYRRWDPSQGRFAVGVTSVPDLIAKQRSKPTERVHQVQHTGLRTN